MESSGKHQPLKRRLAAWLLRRLGLIGVVYGGISWFTADRLTRPTNQPLRIDPHRLSADATAWSARTSDGITLRGWYLPTEERQAPGRAGARDVELVARDGVVGPRSARARFRRASLRSPRARPERSLAALPRTPRAGRHPGRHDLGSGTRASPTTGSAGWVIRWGARRS